MKIIYIKKIFNIYIFILILILFYLRQSQIHQSKHFIIYLYHQIFLPQKHLLYI
jgi:hypothetical protein